jgi:hypothetical protein
MMVVEEDIVSVGLVDAWGNKHVSRAFADYNAGTEDGAKSPWTALKAPYSRIPVIS